VCLWRHIEGLLDLLVSRDTRDLLGCFQFLGREGLSSDCATCSNALYHERCHRCGSKMCQPRECTSARHWRQECKAWGADAGQYSPTKASRACYRCSNPRDNPHNNTGEELARAQRIYNRSSSIRAAAAARATLVRNAHEASEAKHDDDAYDALFTQAAAAARKGAWGTLVLWGIIGALKGKGSRSIRTEIDTKREHPIGHTRHAPSRSSRPPGQALPRSHALLGLHLARERRVAPA
jgi:hypothetical protein